MSVITCIPHGQQETRHGHDRKALRLAGIKARIAEGEPLLYDE
jgi:hypothetical protein